VGLKPSPGVRATGAAVRGAEWEGTKIVIVVIVVAAVVALVLFGLIMARGRSRFSDESERFRYVSDLTSQWSREESGQEGGQGSGQGNGHGRGQDQGAGPGQATGKDHGRGPGQGPGKDQGAGPGQGISQAVHAPTESIDLRDASTAPVDRAATSERR